MTDGALYLAAGLALGLVYFGLLLRAVRLHTAQASAVRVVPLHMLRFGVAVFSFWAIAQQGALPVLAAMLGFIAARFAVQYLTRWGS